MRIIRLKINNAVTTRLGFLNRELKIEDEHFVQDLFALIRLKGNGLPTQKRIEFLIKTLAAQPKQTNLTASIYVKKRVQTMKEIAHLPYFASLSALTDPVFAVDKLLQNMRKLGLKVRQSQCVSCQFKANCDFGKQYEKAVSDITKVIDPDFTKKAHPDCPHLPEMDFVHTLNEAAKLMSSLYDPANQQSAAALMNQLKKDAQRQNPYSRSEEKVDDEALQKGQQLSNLSDPAAMQADDAQQFSEEDFKPTTVSSSAKGGGYDAHFTAEYYVKMQEKLIESLLQVGVEIFNIGRVLDSILGQQDSKLLKETKEVSESRAQDLMRTASDVVKAEKMQHALPNEVFDAKLAKKQLVVEREQKPEGKKHLLYLLIDASGSMRVQFLSNPNSIMSRASLASVLSISLMKKIEKEKGLVFIRYFTGSVSPLIAVRTPDDFKAAIKKIADCNFDGGSTNIKAALNQATRDIAQAQDEIRKAEVLLITDCDDNMTLSKTDLQGAKLNVLDVSGTTNTAADHLRYGTSAASAVLKSVADNYYKADERTLNLKTLVSLA